MVKAASSNQSTLYVWAVITLSFLAVASIVLLLVVQPGRNHTQEISVITGFLLPTVAAFIAAAQRQQHLATNSRLTELLRLTAKSSKAEGNLAGKAAKRRQR